MRGVLAVVRRLSRGTQAIGVGHATVTVEPLIEV